MVGFIFGSKDKDKPWTYEELQKKREMADALMASNIRTPQNVGEGLHSIGKALMYRKLDKKAGAEESRMRDEFNAKWGALLGGGGSGFAGGYGGGGSPSGTWTPDAPGPKPTEVHMGKPDVAKGGLSFGLPKAGTGVASGGGDFGSAVMTPQEMLIEGSKRRGLDPIDVATAISYETGGKFDPMISGPTTQWGTHRGLIQFGEPQAKQHGVDFSNPDAAWRSQLDPDSGAIWSYLDGAGVKSGMGLPEIYSGINAGSVGRMGASDANNGGAPGTVADKVAGMAPHREKAAQFLGGTWMPNEGQNVTASSSGGSAPQGGPAPGGMDLAALVGLASDPMASPAQKAIIETLIQQQMQAADPLRQIEMERAQLELEALKNPKSKQPESLVERTALADAAGLVEGSQERDYYLLTGKMPAGAEGEGTEYGLTPQYGTDKDGNLVAIQFAKDGTSIATPLPEGVALTKGIDKLDLGDSFQYVNTMTGERIGEPVPKNLRAAEAEKAAGSAEGKASGEAAAALSGNASMAALIDQQIQDLKNDPYLPEMLGPVNSRLPNVTEDAARVQARIDQIQGGAFLQARQLLKGGGAITDFEGQKAEAAFVRMNAAQNIEDFTAALDEFNAAVQEGVKKLEAQAGGSSAIVAPAAPAVTLSPEAQKWLED